MSIRDCDHEAMKRGAPHEHDNTESDAREKRFNPPKQLERSTGFPRSPVRFVLGLQSSFQLPENDLGIEIAFAGRQMLEIQPDQRADRSKIGLLEDVQHTPVHPEN